eukprot:5607939-Amphidinium_carterae.1
MSLEEGELTSQLHETHAQFCLEVVVLAVIPAFGFRPEHPSSYSIGPRPTQLNTLYAQDMKLVLERYWSTKPIPLKVLVKPD